MAALLGAMAAVGEAGASEAQRPLDRSREAAARWSGVVRDLDAYAAQGVRDWRVPGLAFAVVKDGQVLLTRAYGVRTLGRPEPATGRTLFAVGSTTKAMTATAIAMLVDDGKLRLDDPVVRHLGAFGTADPVLTAQITVRDLLTHRAGMPNTDYLWYRSGATAAEVLERFARVKPESSPRSRFRYQNVMYHAAGELVAAVSGRSWADFVTERIFRPLGMDDTVALGARRGAGADLATPHFEVAGTVRPIEEASVDNVAAAGSVWSSGADMAKWAAFLLEGGQVGGRALLKPERLQEMFAPQAIVDADGFYPTARLTKPHWTTYGLGWFQQDYAGRAVDFHTGSIDGMVAICGLVRDERLGVVVLANLDHAELRHALLLRALDAFAPVAQAGRADKTGPAVRPRDWSAELLKLYGELREKERERRKTLEASRATGTRPSLALERYAGDYADPLYGRAQVVLEAGSLWLVAGQRLGGRLEHWNYDTWRTVPELPWLDPAYVRFVLDSQGRPARMVVADLGDPDDAGASFARQAEKTADEAP